MYILSNIRGLNFLFMCKFLYLQGNLSEKSKRNRNEKCNKNFFFITKINYKSPTIFILVMDKFAALDEF